MLSFYSIVVVIAIILLIIGLTIVGLTLKKKQNVVLFPEYQNTCPDFWTLTSANKCTPPTTAINTPSPSKVGQYSNNAVTKSSANAITSIDVSENSWESICTKSKWAKNVGILWDGVANNNACS